MRRTLPLSLLNRYLLCLCLTGSASAVVAFDLPSAHAKQPTAAAPADDTADESTEGDTEDGEGTEEASEETAPSDNGAEDLESLRAEYFKLRDRLFQSKARASAVASALYSTRLSIRLDYDSARYYTVTRATIRLDGANIFDDTSGAIASDDASRFEGYIAPGRHTLSIRIEATGKDDDRFTSIIDNSFVVQASKGKDLDVKVSTEDGGNIAYAWSKKERGSYKLQMNVDVKTLKRGAKDAKGKRTGEIRKHERTAKRRG